MGANGTAAQEPAGMLLDIKAAAVRLGTTVATYKRLHLADPDAYPATRIGVQWRVPAAFVDARTAWQGESR